MTEKKRKFKYLNSSYYITDQGHIENADHHRLKPFDNGEGYLTISLSSNGHRKNFYIHRLVAMKFIDNPNLLPEVNHKDGNKKNNSVSNLEWVSRKESVHHAIKTGLTPTGSRSWNAKLTSDQAELVFDAYWCGISVLEIMNALNISRHTVCDIAKGDAYKNETKKRLKELQDND